MIYTHVSGLEQERLWRAQARWSEKKRELQTGVSPHSVRDNRYHIVLYWGDTSILPLPS